MFHSYPTHFAIQKHYPTQYSAQKKQMKQFFNFILTLVLLLTCEENWADNIYYTLLCQKQSSNKLYDDTYDVTIEGMTWNAPGNQNFTGHWRVGGKNIDNENRQITGKTPMGSAISKVTLNHDGTTNISLTVNSIKLIIASDADFNNIIETLNKKSPSVSSPGSLDFIPTNDTWAKDSYYKLIINVSNTTTTNQGLDITSLQFFSPSEPNNITTVVHPSYGYATACFNCNVIVPSNNTVYYASAVNESSVTFTAFNQDDVISSGTGLLINKPGGGNVTFDITNDAPTCNNINNYLVGVTEAGTAITESGYTNYILSTYNDGNVEKFGFCLPTEPEFITTQNRAYLHIPTPTNVPQEVKILLFDDTFINSTTERKSIYFPMYNLAGQIVGKGYKGFVIENGKKTLIR